MSIAEDLATICVCASMHKEAADDNVSLPEVRNQFEHSVGKERALRRHVGRLSDLARRRAEEEDTSLGGYAGTFAKRLAPIPQTLGEAGWRLPAINAGGIAGYFGGKHVEGIDPLKLSKLTEALDPLALKSLVSPSTGGKGREGLQAVLEQAFKAKPPTFQQPLRRGQYAHFGGPSPSKILSTLGTMTPEELAGVVQVPKILPLSAEQVAVRKNIEDLFGAKRGVPYFRQEVENIIRSNAKAPKGLASVIEAVVPRPYRVGGAIAGLGAASILTGLPLAIRALWQKRTGGEAAARARSSMEQAMAEAEAESQKREGLLGSLPKAAAAIKKALGGSSTELMGGFQAQPAGAPATPKTSARPLQNLTRAIPQQSQYSGNMDQKGIPDTLTGAG